MKVKEKGKKPITRTGNLPDGFKMNNFKRVSQTGDGVVSLNRAPKDERERDIARILGNLAKKRGGRWSFSFEN